jgi:hypothetical protein
MYIYKTLNIQSQPICTERAGPDNILIGDIVRYNDKNGDFNYCRVDTITNRSLHVTQLFYSEDELKGKVFLLDPNYNKNNFTHKGTLNYNYTIHRSVRKIMIVDRNQLL